MRVTLGELGAGEIFGEMSVIDEKPRSASIQVLEDCGVKVLHRDQFLDVLAQDRDLAAIILSNLFTRLRRANSTRKSSKEIQQLVDIPREESIRLVGLTNQAQRVLSQTPLLIATFPFVVGRETRDPLARQDLAIFDSAPYQISRHHVMFERDSQGFFLQDMGSKLGSKINEHMIGGGSDIDHHPIKNGDVLTLGGKNSPYVFRIEI